LEPISAIITAAGKNRRMKHDMEERGINYQHKLTLDIKGVSVLGLTINNVLESKVGECIVILGHFHQELMPIVDEINDPRLRVIFNQDVDVELSQTLLNGVLNAITDYCLCVAADQPTVSTETINNLIKTLLKCPEPENTVSILSRGDLGFLKSAQGLGMPFICHRRLLMKYLPGNRDNLNPILKEMVKDGVKLFAISPRQESELVNINRYGDYLRILQE
jgi:molybdenum cofactor cytidylyltransferase